MKNMKRGKVMYVPPVIVDELEDIMREDRVDSTIIAQKNLCDYARVGREVKRLKNLDFSGAVRRIPTNELLRTYPQKQQKRTKKSRGLFDL